MSEDSTPHDETMELIAEMAALGLPTNFVTRLDISRKGLRRPSNHTRQSAAEELSEYCAEETPIPLVGRHFCERSVWLYTPTDSTSSRVVDDTLGIQQELEDATVDNPIPVTPSSPHFEDVIYLSGKETGPVEEVGTSWEPFWDEQYQCYYFCNSKTLESTWEPPHGFEHYISFADQDICSGINYAGTLDERATVKPTGIEKVEQEANDSRQFQEESFGSEDKQLDQCETTDVGEALLPFTSDFLTQEDLSHEMEVLPTLPMAYNSHIRFSDSDESSSDSGRIGWEEIEVEKSMVFDGQEESEACSPSSHESTIHAGSVKRHLQSAKASVNNEESKRKKFAIQKRSRRSSAANKLAKLLLPGMVEVIGDRIVKYWIQRYNLFSKYDDGIKMDEEGWFSVTPEIIARHQACRCAVGTVIDAFTGVGGNAIQFALRNLHVIAIDIDPMRVEYARHNAEIYGVADKIEFIVGDFFQLAPSLKADVVFLSPPWGGPEYLCEEIYNLETMLQPKDGFTLFKVAQVVAPNIALFLPRNVDVNQLHELSWLSSPLCNVEKNFVNDKLKAVTAYYGDIADSDL